LKLNRKGKKYWNISNADSTFIGSTLKRYKCSPRKKMKTIMKTKELVKKMRDSFRRKSDQTLRKMAKELVVSRISFWNFFKNDLKLKSFKKQKVHGFTEAQKAARVQKCYFVWHGDDLIRPITNRSYYVSFRE
jgi:hypothetical protein